jgi:two-component system response regulator NreC
MPIKVLIVDDHTVVRQGLKLLLEAQPEIEVVGEAADGSETLHLAAAYRQRPDGKPHTT